jgi:3-hydroxyisobutyrate dehydrogenase-like beta-hydroxyacid dehydrogenase
MSDHSTPTIAVLYPGDMGAALAAVLKLRGYRVVTTLQERGQQTIARSREVGLEVLDSLADVVRQSNIVLSLVPPAAAEEMAAAYCSLAHLAPADALYVDVNSIGPELKAAIAAKLDDAGRGFVDAAVNGLAKNLTKSGTLFLSGARAKEAATLFEGPVRVRVLGDEIGRAAAMKMLLAGLSKGLCGLFAELALMAQRRGLLGEMLQASSAIYPGMMLVVDRMLPTYAEHAARRATEMSELEETARAAGIEPCVIEAVRRLHEEIAAVSFDAAGEKSSGFTVASLIERLAAEGVLDAAATLAGGASGSQSNR